MLVPAAAAASKRRRLASTFCRTVDGEDVAEARDAGWPREVEDAVVARRVELVLGDVDTRDRKAASVLLLQRRS
jgi:hypothetical protein